MSLSIDVDLVTQVLLGDRWYQVADASFAVDSYEFEWSGRDGMTVEELKQKKPDAPAKVLHSGGSGGVCSVGSAFRTGDGDRLAGPLTADRGGPLRDHDDARGGLIRS